MKQNKIPRNEYIRKPVGKTDPYKDDVIYGKLGQYTAPGQVTKIPGDAYGTPITMQGVPYPVYGEDDLGYGQMMLPNMDYTFPGNTVTEYPIPTAQDGGWLNELVTKYIYPYGDFLTGESEYKINNFILKDLRQQLRDKKINFKEYKDKLAQNAYNKEGKKLSETWNRNISMPDVHPANLNASYDALYMHQGLPQKYNSFIKSQYRPTVSKNSNSTYYSFSPDLEKEIIEDLTTYNNKDFINSSEKERMVKGSLVGQASLRNFKYSKGKDDKGDYISYYDINDYGNLLDLIGKPFEIYGRIYLDPKTGKPITTKAYGGDPSLPNITGHYQKGGWLDQYQKKGEVMPSETTQSFIPAGLRYKMDQLKRQDPKQKQKLAEEKKYYENIAKAKEDARKQEVADRKARIADSIEAQKESVIGNPNWREVLARQTQATGDKFRVSDEPNFFDDYINPGVWIGDMASGLGQAPYVAKETDSNLPYVLGVGAPLVTGALEGIGGKSTKDFITNIISPIPFTGEAINKGLKGAKKVIPKAKPAVNQSTKSIKNKVIYPSKPVEELSEDLQPYLYRDVVDSKKVYYDPKGNIIESPSGFNPWGVRENIGDVKLINEDISFDPWNPSMTYYGKPVMKFSNESYRTFQEEGGETEDNTFRKGGLFTPPKLKRKVKKQGTSKNIATSVNKLFTRNYDVFGPSGKNIYNPNVYKTGGQSTGWLDNLD